MWDMGTIRVQGAIKIADAIQEKIVLNKEMEVIDFGTGTGLLGFLIAEDVKQVHGIDTSKNMLQKLEEKNSPELFIKTYCQDIIKIPLTQKFDGLVSSMTLHHIEDLKLFFTTIFNTLNKNGFIAIADLTIEDGTFHSNNDGVFHFGFDKNELSTIVKECGFKDVKFEVINSIKKPHKDFDIFLLSAGK
ncbi:MAG: class I SAM-dependent methyltransferase [Campylobacterota bacterium]|nr:class I SAM-dependent methyltransferase [Campylobacterota bacterium]